MREHFRELREQSAKRVEIVSKSETTTFDANKKPIKKRQKQRVNLPREPYRVRPDMEEIRSRWNYIKTRERVRKRQRNDLETLTKTGDQIDSGSGPFAKSQPNLSKEDEERGGAMSSSPSDLLEEPNFILLYELNLNSRLNKKQRAWPDANGRSSSTSIKRGPTQQWWCQKRIVKIVDVRTLKRTISLPESLIYSNNLLKRFNILKL